MRPRPTDRFGPDRRRRSLLSSVGALAGAGLLAGCLDRSGSTDGTGSPAPGTGTPTPSGTGTLESSLTREPPSAESGAVETLVAGNTAFALDLLADLAGGEGGNVFVSPYSVSVALAMTWAGARGVTEAQMANALSFELDQDRLHPAFNALDRRLTRPPETDDRSAAGNGTREDGDAGDPFTLRFANAVWGQDGYPFLDSYLDVLARHYGAGLRTVDFAGGTEAARRRINAWVADRTEDAIEELLSPGVLTALTRLVLTNAIYFRAGWEHPFPEAATADHPFTALDGTRTAVPTMRRRGEFRYTEIDGHQAVELPYVGGTTSMVVLLPAAGEFEAFERDLDAEALSGYVDALRVQEGSLSLPRFSVETKVSLKDALSRLGMPVAFDPGRAEFGGMARLDRTGRNLFLQDVVHRSHVSVDEQGTEAAAATAVVVGETSAPANPFEMVVDRPFLFLVRDRETGTVLFLGRVVEAPADAS